MIEVEIKLPVPDLDTVREKLTHIGFQESGYEREQDTYYDNAAEDIRTGGQALRIRETVNLLTGKSTAQINFKGKKLDQITVTRQELETDIADGETGRQILEAIGFHRVMPEVIKERRELKRGGMTACLDQVTGLGSFLELEVMAETEEDRDAAMKQIEAVLSQLGYQVTDTVRSSYLSMLQKNAV